MRQYCADIETDGFDPTKIWVMTICEVIDMKPVRMWSVHDYDELRELMAEDVQWVIHHGYGFDKPALERLLDVPMKGELIDSLGLSWYLEPKRNRHGLEGYGEEFGVPKPKIDDWIGLSIEEYTHRCEEDVKIQTKLWQRQWKHLMLLYKDEELAMEAARHLSGKMKALAVAQKSKWKLDVPEAERLLEMFNGMFEEAKDALEKEMPMVPVYVNKTRPKKPYKKDGTLSATGIKWEVIVKEHDKYFDYMGVIKHQTGFKDPNAGSSLQLKNWLFDLGWKPQSFDFKRDKDTGEVRKIPQIKDKDTGELCKSIAVMIEHTPALDYLREMGVVKHRSSVVGGFLKNCDQNGYIVAGAQGFTNTLRLRHKVALNIPSRRKPYGKEIRGLLVARGTNYELLGSDMASLEDRTKQHWMWPHDPEYVKDMLTEGFDPHLDMAVEAQMMTQAESDLFKFNKVNGVHDAVQEALGLIRYAGKTTNYAATYGAGPTTIARAAGVPEKDGEILHAAYWRRNWSLKAIADECIVKESRGMKWLWNPVSKMWYFLKAEKDKFSTLNQGTGAFLFDKWVEYILDRRPQLNGQFHDEIIIEILKGHREEAEKLLRDAIAYVNDTYKLNRELDIDVDFGSNYAEIH